VKTWLKRVQTKLLQIQVDLTSPSAKIKRQEFGISTRWFLVLLAYHAVGCFGVVALNDEFPGNALIIWLIPFTFGMFVHSFGRWTENRAQISKAKLSATRGEPGNLSLTVDITMPPGVVLDAMRIQRDFERTLKEEIKRAKEKADESNRG
jgi:hypothetical protein